MERTRRISCKGKKEVVKKCNQTAAYFKSVETRFKVLNVIAAKNRVAINGTAEFIRKGTTVAFVSSCDVYEFDGRDRIKSINSYCITGKTAKKVLG